MPSVRLETPMLVLCGRIVAVTDVGSVQYSYSEGDHEPLRKNGKGGLDVSG